jgi:hypothetical protein
MLIESASTAYRASWGTSHVLTMVADDDRIWHRMTFIDSNGIVATIKLTAEEARDLFLALKVSVDK